MFSLGSRVGFYVNTFKNVSSLEAKFHKEIAVVSNGDCCCYGRKWKGSTGHCIELPTSLLMYIHGYCSTVYYSALFALFLKILPQLHYFVSSSVG